MYHFTLNKLNENNHTLFQYRIVKDLNECVQIENKSHVKTLLKPKKERIE